MEQEKNEKILTLQKDISSEENSKKRVNIRKILPLDDVITEPYSNVTIELKENF